MRVGGRGKERRLVGFGPSAQQEYPGHCSALVQRLISPLPFFALLPSCLCCGMPWHAIAMPLPWPYDQGYRHRHDHRSSTTRPPSARARPLPSVQPFLASPIRVHVMTHARLQFKLLCRLGNAMQSKAAQKAKNAKASHCQSSPPPALQKRPARRTQTGRFLVDQRLYQCTAGRGTSTRRTIAMLHASAALPHPPLQVTLAFRCPPPA